MLIRSTETFSRMGVLGILVPLSNAKHNHVSLTFAEKPAPMASLAGVLDAKYKQMIDDIQATAALPAADVRIYHGNSKEASKILPDDKKATAVITSPPYPNRFSYARRRAPTLLLRLHRGRSGRRPARNRRHRRHVGQGNVGSGGGISPANPLIESLLAPYTTGIGESGMLMASYVTKFFNDLYLHAAEITKGARGRYSTGLCDRQQQVLRAPVAQRRDSRTHFWPVRLRARADRPDAPPAEQDRALRGGGLHAAPVNSGLACNPPSQMLL